MAEISFPMGSMVTPVVFWIIIIRKSKGPPIFIILVSVSAFRLRLEKTMWLPSRGGMGKHEASGDKKHREKYIARMPEPQAIIEEASAAEEALIDAAMPAKPRIYPEPLTAPATLLQFP